MGKGSSWPFDKLPHANGWAIFQALRDSLRVASGGLHKLTMQALFLRQNLLLLLG
jgi:hypothetical protein